MGRVRDIRQPGHFWADNEIVDDYLPAIGAYGFAVYMLLAKHADSKTGQCDPSVEGMAKKLDLSAPTVRKALDKLEAQKLITIKHRRREKNGKLINQTSIYTLLAVEKHQTDTPGKRDLVPNEIDQGTKRGLGGVLNVVDQGTKGDLPGVLNHVSSNNTHKNNTQSPSSESSGGGDEEAFVKGLLQTFNISETMARKIAQSGADLDTVIASIRSNYDPKNDQTMGRILKRIVAAPPEKGHPYDGPYGKPSTQNGTGPRPVKTGTLSREALAALAAKEQSA